MLIKYEFSGFEKCHCYAFASTSFKKNFFLRLPGEDISAFLTLTYFFNKFNHCVITFRVTLTFPACPGQCVDGTTHPLYA